MGRIYASPDGHASDFAQRLPVHAKHHPNAGRAAAQHGGVLQLS
ncbi:hypothetical protein [Hydrogenophaga sp.]